MRRTMILLMTMALSLLMASGIAVAESQLDQQQTLDDGGFAVVDQINTTPEPAQTFTAGKSGTLDKVSLDVGCCVDGSGNVGGTPPPFGLFVGVYEVESVDSTGSPLGDPIGWGSVPDSDFSTDGSLKWVDVPLKPSFSRNGIVSAGKQYMILVEVNSCFSDDPSNCPPESTSAYQWGRTTPDAYAGGTAWKISPVYPSSWAYESQDDYDFAFKTFVSPDTTAPTVSGVTPAEGATDVASTTNVVATFSEAMDASSVTAAGNFTLLKDGSTSAVPAKVSYDSASKKATLVPSAPLDAASTYTATLSGAKDLAGNTLDEDPSTSGDQAKSWSFTTAVPDTTPPQVIGTIPAEDATGVSSTANVKATFSEAMMPSTINAQTFELFRKGSTTKIGASVSYNPTTNRGILDPTNSLKSGVTYKAVVSTGVEDLAGNQLDQDPTLLGNQPKRWFFTVGN